MKLSGGIRKIEKDVLATIIVLLISYIIIEGAVTRKHRWQDENNTEPTERKKESARLD